MFECMQNIIVMLFHNIYLFLLFVPEVDELVICLLCMICKDFNLASPLIVVGSI